MEWSHGAGRVREVELMNIVLELEFGYLFVFGDFVQQGLGMACPSCSVVVINRELFAIEAVSNA